MPKDKRGSGREATAQEGLPFRPPKEDDIRRIAGTRPHLALALLALVMLAAAGCVGLDNPEGWAGTALGDGVLVASTGRGELSALSTDDFSSVWTFPTGEEDPKIDLEAIYGTPLIIGDTVYFGAYSGDVYALSLEDGEVLWRFKADGPVIGGLAAAQGTGNTPTAGPAETIYVTTDNGTVYALDAAGGKEERRFDAGESIWAAPLLAEGVLYIASVNGRLHALDADTLDPIWDAPFETAHGLISDPVLADGTVLVGGIGRTLHAVDAETGQQRWSFKAGNWFWGKPLVADGTVYVPNLDGRLYALSLADGDRAWEFKAEDPLRSAPVLAGDALVIADRAGNVYGLDPDDGSEKWSAPAALLQTVLADSAVLEGRALISAQGGDLFSVDAAAGTFERVVVE